MMVLLSLNYGDFSLLSIYTGSLTFTMTEWRTLFDGSRVIPPHNQSVRLAEELPPACFQIALKHLQGGSIGQRLLEGLQGVRFQLRVSLFDVSHRHFFGRTWKSPLLHQTRTGSGQAGRVPFNEVLYFHTSLRHPGVVAVVEVVSVAQKADGSQSALGCGFGIMRLFPSQASPGEPRAGQADRRLNLYHGSPRGLLYQTLQEPIEQSALMTPMEGAHLQYSLKPHPALEAAAHLLPPNVPVSGAESVPGIVPSSGETDSLQKPRLLKSFTCYLDKLSLTLYPSLEKFEEELLQLLNADHLSRKNWHPDGNSVVIQERRLHVGVHNGWGFLERPQVVVVEPEAEGGRGRSGSFRRGSLSRLSSPAPQVLALRSRLQLKEMVKHPAFAIVFLLEYVFSAPVSADAKVTLASSFSRTAFMQCLRWAVWCPFQEPGNAAAADVTLALQGGDVRGPSGVMVYAAPPPDRSSTEVRDLERGTVKFRFSARSEGRPPSPALSLKNRQEEASRHKKPPSPSRGLSETAPRVSSPPQSPPGPGLSISQLAASPRYPTISHSTSSPWQQQFPSQLYPSPLVSAYQLSHIELPCASSIAHLEVSLSAAGETDRPPPAEQLRELPFAPVHAPVTTLGTQTSGAASSLSRSSMAQLSSAGFPEILDLNGQAAEVLDPAEPVNFNPQREEADPLQCNELVLQFLAFSRVPQEGVNDDWPNSVHFTFQLYRFPPVTTNRMTLLSADKPERKSRDKRPCVLALVNKDGTVDSGTPGLQLKYLVDPGFLKPGEQRWFLRYLALHTLQIDVWDSDSLLLVGSAGVELKHLLRQGRPAVQLAQELEVITTEYLQDAPPARGAVATVSAFTAVRGRLHLRLGNIGRLADVNPKKSATLPPARSHVIVARDGTGGFGGGGISARSVASLNARNTCRARRLAETDGELASLLHGRAREAGVAAGRPLQETEETRRRKLERMAAARRYEEQGGVGAPARPSVTSRREERVQHLRDLQLIEAYRERSKAESITSMLARAITTQHTLYATLGAAEFFEFVLKNPFNVPQTVTVESEDPELSVIVNYGEWKHFKSLTKTMTPLEEDMFHLKDGTLAPQVYLRPKETVYVPLKYQTFTSEPATVTQTPANKNCGRNANVAQKHQSNTVQPKTIKVTFRAEDGKPLAICQVDVEPTPHVIDQTFRFYHPELTFLKKAIRLPPWDVLPGVPARGSDTPPHIQVRCSDPNIICDTRRVAPDEPQDVFLKVAGGQSPQIKKFFIMVFIDEWLAAPAQIWQVYVHFLQRVDLSCVTGQLTWQSLVLRGSQALRKVRCHSSLPGEIQIDPPGAFALPPNAVQDLQIGVRPRRAGCRFAYLNVVDAEYRQLVASWLLCVSCRQPLISKAFEIFLPVGGGRGSNKKITYTNPYPYSRVFLLSSDHPDLLQFKENSFQIGGGETYTIGLRFAPSQCAGAEEILVYINDHEDKNEETFCIKVQYQ
ncbi:nephrocystin-4 isoform X2 [Anguilla rostrata]|uniref:nephrocystin-4 isoform X2 n=1 Tax=Anguilla rostrata TaxID=7938 RepID=UPI0030CC8179